VSPTGLAASAAGNYQSGAVMSRVAAGDVIEVKATNNVYTVLVIVAFLAELIAFVALYMRFAEIVPETAKGLFG
jgi:hypothetical protein